MTIRLDPAGLDVRVARLGERAAELAGRRDAISAEVDGLLAGWRGVASRSFAEAWAQWQEAADDVVLTLEATVVALRRTGADLVSADGAGAESHRRLGERLG